MGGVAGDLTIADFLLARIAEDESEARKGGQHNDSGVFARDNYGCLLVQPSRILAECEAKRAIINEHGPQEVASLDRATWAKLFIVCRCCAIGPRQVVAPCPTLKHLAAAYSDHPDYQDAWRAE